MIEPKVVRQVRCSVPPLSRHSRRRETLGRPTAPSSQLSEPPGNPGKFTFGLRRSRLSKSEVPIAAANDPVRPRKSQIFEWLASGVRLLLRRLAKTKPQTNIPQT